jgi:hypothetical protein
MIIISTTGPTEVTDRSLSIRGFQQQGGPYGTAIKYVWHHLRCNLSLHIRIDRLKEANLLDLRLMNERKVPILSCNFYTTTTRHESWSRRGNRQFIATR